MPRFELNFTIKTLGAATLLAIGLACSGLMPPTEVPAPPPPPTNDLETKGAAVMIKEQLGTTVCAGSVAGDPLNGTSGLVDKITPVSTPMVLVSKWMDGDAAPADAGEVKELANADYAGWYGALDTFCTPTMTCDKMTCTLSPSAGVIDAIAARAVDGKPMIVGAFTGVTLTNDTAGLEAAKAAWMQAIAVKYDGATPEPEGKLGKGGGAGGAKAGKGKGGKAKGG